MDEQNGHHPPDGPGDGSPEQTPDPRAVQAAVDERIRKVVQQELQAFMGELQSRGVFDRPLAAQSAPAPSALVLSGGHLGVGTAPQVPGRGLGDFLGTLLNEPGKLVELADSVLTVWLKAKQAQNPVMNQIDFLNQIQANNPQLLSAYAPNPFGSGFQTIMTQALIMGMKVGAYGGTAKKAADQLPNEGWLKDWAGLPEPSANSLIEGRPQTPTPPAPSQTTPTGGVPERPRAAAVGQTRGRRFSDL